MLRRAALLLAVGAMLVGCVSNQVGTDFASVSQKVGPPRVGHSRIVLLQDKRNGLSMQVCACEVKLDGAPLGKVVAGKYAFADRPAGRHELLVTELMFPGDTKREIVMEAGRTHFISSRAAPGTMPQRAARSSAAWPGLPLFPLQRRERPIPGRPNSLRWTRRPRERSLPNCKPWSEVRCTTDVRSDAHSFGA